ncbi:Phytochrome A-associated F-box protein [Rhynchospora pubera]|uniref:Phytochrome A-associated F-box protein n=1 Tax=Rhynchospora pubera TaxID=906938 RepID=A0AAV8GFD4_9POAL|nr:Phytochrome A-associated F-box protein [Rhynchospora pubera]
MASSASASPPPWPSPICVLPDDLLLKILSLLPSASDPRHLPRLSAVSLRLRRLLLRLSPLPSSLPLPLPPSPALPYLTLHKLTACCPGLSHAGVLLHHLSPDFGLALDIGPDLSLPSPSSSPSPSSVAASLPPPNNTPPTTTTWSLFDDLYLDSSYDFSETLLHNNDSAAPAPAPAPAPAAQPNHLPHTSSPKRRKKHAPKNKWLGPTAAHLATGNWSLSREQGSKLLASRFRGDSLYICDWPGCVHEEEKRKYMLFRGVFPDFKKSRVWKTIVDSKKGRIKLHCAYCSCNEMWDLHSAFCLRGFIGFHEDGEPVVRAYVCDNGHVSGAWTERPMYG